MKQHFLHGRPGPLSFSIEGQPKLKPPRPDHKSKRAQLHDDNGMLVLCRGCSLSGDVAVGYVSEMCEICDCHEPLTVEAIEKLAALITRPPKPEPAARLPIGHRPYVERVGELLVANNRYQEESRVARAKLAVAMANLRNIGRGIYDGGATYEAAMAFDAIADVERTT